MKVCSTYYPVTLVHLHAYMHANQDKQDRGREPNTNTFHSYPVIEWDASSHAHAYSLWLKAVLSDGGEGCRKKTELSGEPLIPGMLVGNETDLLTTSQTHQVGSPLPCPFPMLSTNDKREIQKLTDNQSSTRTNTPTKQPTSRNGHSAESTR